MDLNERQQKVLFCVVNEYIKSKKPVSSEKIIESTNISHSSATVRNDLKKLEYLNYVRHLHTSSGRIPTDKGYRFYVDSILELSKQTKYSKEMEIFPDYPQGNVDQVITRVSTLLSRTLPVIAIITKPTTNRIKIRSLQIHKTFEDYITIVLSTELGMIKSQTILKQMSEENVKEIEKFLNNSIVNKTIDEIRSYINREAGSSEKWKGTNVENIFDILKSITEDYGEERYTIRGVENLIDDEIIDHKVLRRLVRTLETPDKFYDFIKEYGTVDEMKIFVGSEHFQEGMESFSSFIVPYKVMDESIGYVLSIGAKVIDYQKTMALTLYIGNRLTELLTFLSRMIESKR